MKVCYQQLARVMKAISDPKRLQIVSMLREEELGAGSLLAAFEITQPTLSHDMHILVQSGLVKERRIGKNVLYSLDREAVSTFLETLDSVVQGEKGTQA